MCPTKPRKENNKCNSFFKIKIEFLDVCFCFPFINIITQQNVPLANVKIKKINNMLKIIRTITMHYEL